MLIGTVIDWLAESLNDQSAGFEGSHGPRSVEADPYSHDKARQESESRVRNGGHRVSAADETTPLVNSSSFAESANHHGQHAGAFSRLIRKACARGNVKGDLFIGAHSSNPNKC